MQSSGFFKFPITGPEIRKASQLPDLPVPANHARFSRAGTLCDQGQFGSLGLQMYKCVIRRVKSELPLEFCFTSRR
jgi:hypothetical protein